MGYVTSDHDRIEDEAEDRGYKRAVSDIIDWHKNELTKLDESIKKAFVGPEGRQIQIGVVWEGKYCSASELEGLVHFHTEMVKALKEKFVK